MNLPGGPEAPEPDPPCEEPEEPEATSTTADVPNDEPDPQDPAQSSEALAPDLVRMLPSQALNGASEVLHPAVDAASLRLDTGSPPSDAAPAAPMAQNTLQIVEVEDLDWQAVRNAVNPSSIRANMRSIVERMEALLDRADGPGMLFDNDRADPADKVIQVSAMDTASPLWIVGDLHGDLLALEAALAAMRDQASQTGEAKPRIVFLGDLFDDEGFGLEVLLRVFELIVDAPDRVCLIAGNHDEALSYDGVRFASSVSPSDFADFLNANLAHEWIERAGKLAVRLFARAPRALFFPDGLLVAHGGFPLVDLHRAACRNRRLE